MRRASGRSEVTTNTAVPSSASSVMIRWISSFAPTSTPWVGSASTSSPGRSTSCRASTTFCAFPPDIAPIAWRSDGVLTASRLIMSLATDRSRPRSIHTLPLDSSGRWPAEMLKAIDWNENMPCSFRFAGSSAMPSRWAWPGDRGEMGWPSSRISPTSARSIPYSVAAISLTPDPISPYSATISPGRTTTFTSWNSPARPNPSNSSRGVAAGSICRSWWVSVKMPPTISSTTLRTERSSIGYVPTVRPSRITVTSWAILNSSSSRCEM